MSYTVYYHGACKKFLGRAHGPLTILSEAGADFEIKGKEDAPAGTTGFAVPMVTFPEGYTIGQQGAICAALGKELGLFPKSAKAEAIALNIVENMMDLHSDSSKADEARLAKWLGTFDAALESGFMAGASLTYADCAAYHILKKAVERYAEDQEKKLSLNFPKLKKWMDMCVEPQPCSPHRSAPFVPSHTHSGTSRPVAQDGSHQGRQGSRRDGCSVDASMSKHDFVTRIRSRKL